MRGKRVSTGSPKSGHRGDRQPAAGIGRAEPGSRRPAQRLDLTKTRRRHEGRLDRRACSGPAGCPPRASPTCSPPPATRSSSSTSRRSWPRCRRSTRRTRQGVIPAATYRLPPTSNTIVVPNVLLVRDDLDANVACVLTKTLFDRKAAAGAGQRRGQGHQPGHARANRPGTAASRRRAGARRPRGPAVGPPVTAHAGEFGIREWFDRRVGRGRSANPVQDVEMACGARILWVKACRFSANRLRLSNMSWAMCESSSVS